MHSISVVKVYKLRLLPPEFCAKTGLQSLSCGEFARRNEFDTTFPANLNFGCLSANFKVSILTVILTGDRLHWLKVEEIEGDPETIKARLDEAYQIPRPKQVSVTKSAAA